MSQSAPSASYVLRFDNFELDLRAGELRKKGVRLRLHGQPLQILAILLQSAGTLVTREEIHRQVWQADTFVDFDHSLHNAIARVREVLGDSAQAPRYIETLPRRGYRFIGQVEQAQLSATPITSETGESVSSRLPASTPPQARRLTTGMILALCACVVGAIAWTVWRDYRAGRSNVTRRSIAVLPLQNLSGDPAQDFFAEAMTDELITEVSRIQALKVISRTSVMGYKNTREHLPQIARELQADDIVEGSIVRDGDEVRVTVQLLDAPNDRHLWSEEYQRPLGSILILQKEIAQSIAQQVRVTLNPQQQAQLGPAPAVAPRAYEAYLRGRYNLNLLFARHQPLDPAKEYFEESIRKDPGFAPAYAGLADTDINIAFTQHRWSPDIYRSAMQAAQKALQLDDHNGEAHATLAMLKWNFDWDWAGAERELQYAIAVDPSYDCARDYHASLLAWEGRRNEALAEVKRARELNAGSSFATTESSIYFQMRDFPGLIEVTRKAVISEPDDWVEQYFLGIGYEGSGRWSEAVAQYQKAVAMSGGDRDPTSALVHAYAVLGRRPQAEKLLLALQHSAKDEPISPYFLAVIFAGFGEKDKALGLLEEAQREKSVELMWSVRADPRIDSLRSDERFQAMLRRCNFPQMIVVLSQ